MRPMIYFVLILAQIGCGQADMRSSKEPAALETAAPEEVAGRQDEAATADRKIIYEAVVRLVVNEFEEAQARLEKLVKDHDGYLADVSVDRSTGQFPFGRWTARVPIARYEPFLDAVAEVGVMESLQQTAKDVTEEYIDLEARISNQQQLEKRLLSLLDKSGGEVKDLVEIERELARVRGDVERMQGRLRYLANRVSFTTVTLEVRQQRDYVPPQSPSLFARARDAWSQSWGAMAEFGGHLLVAATFLAPWALVAAIVGAPLFWGLCRWRKAAGR